MVSAGLIVVNADLGRSEVRRGPQSGLKIPTFQRRAEDQTEGDIRKSVQPCG